VSMCAHGLLEYTTDIYTSALTEALKADHGFNVDSSAIRDLISIMTGYDDPSRRAFLQFITGSPKLPIGGMSADNKHVSDLGSRCLQASVV
jgi:hypothetical protein